MPLSPGEETEAQISGRSVALSLGMGPRSPGGVTILAPAVSPASLFGLAAGSELNKSNK